MQTRETSEGGSKRATAILFATLVIVMLGFGIAIPLMPFYITHFNASGAALGLMISLYSIMQFLFAPMWGRISDRIGRKPVLLVGIAGFGMAFLLQGLSQNLFQFMATRTLAGAISAAALPTAMAFVADTTSPENRSRGVGLMGAAMGLGMIFGPVLGGMLTHVHPTFLAPYTEMLQVTIDPATGETINLSIPFFASALLAFLAIPFVVALLPESLPPERRALHTPMSASPRFGSLLVGLRGPVGFLYVLAFLVAFALTNMEAVLVLYGKQRFSMGPTDVGYLMGAMGILAVIQQGVVIGPLTKRVGEARVVQGGLVISILGFLGMALAPAVGWLIVAALVFSAGSVLLHPSVTALISRRAMAGQGEAMGMNQSFQSLGRAVGPLWAGLAFDIYATLSFWTGALVQVIALIYSLRMLPAPAVVPAGAVQQPQPAAVAVED